MLAVLAITAAYTLANIGIGTNYALWSRFGRNCTGATWTSAANKLVSSVHALTTTAMAVIILTDPVWNNADFIAHLHPVTPWLVRLEIGYLLADTFVLLVVDKRSAEPILLIHHVVLAIALPFLLKLRKGDFYVAAMFLMNASTPLLHARYAIGKSRWRGGTVHAVATITLLCAFIACRIGVWPVLFGIEARRATQFEEADIERPRWYCFAAALGFVVMNGTWVYKLLRQSLHQELSFVRRSER